MKKYFLLPLLATFWFPMLALATSGACASHAGVNCAVGADKDGSVICNDGWADSSTFFSDADECKVTCTPPTASGCTTENDYGVLNLQIARQSAYTTSVSGQSALLQCRNQINSYQASLQAYNTCEASISVNNTSAPTNTDSYLQAKMQDFCINSYGPNSYSDYANKTCRCDTGYAFGTGGQCTKVVAPPVPVVSSCADLHGVHARAYSLEANPIIPCICEDGYGFDKQSQCVPIAISCFQDIGPHSHPTSSNGCGCDEGYYKKYLPFSIAGGKCLADPDFSSSTASIPTTKTVAPKLSVHRKTQSATTTKRVLPLGSSTSATLGSFSSSTNLSSGDSKPPVGQKTEKQKDSMPQPTIWKKIFGWMKFW